MIVAEEFQERYPDSVKYMKIPAVDDEEFDLGSFFDQGHKFIRGHIEEGRNVLVHCRAGRSRSAAMVMAFLMKENGLTFEEAYHTLKKKRRCVSPNKGFKRQLQ